MTHLDRHLLDLALARERLLDRNDLAAAGISRNQWARRTGLGFWVPMAPGVWRHLATEETWHLRARAVMRWLGEDAALHGLSALRWWGIAPDDPEHVDVLVPRSRRHLDGPCRLHTNEWQPTSLRRFRGIRLQEPASAIVAAAASGLEVRGLERLADEAIRQRRMSVSMLSRRIDQSTGSGHRHIRILRTLLLDTGGESYLERRLLRLVRKAGLPRPTCQVVHRSDGKRIARVDFLFPGTDVVVEVTGRLGHASDAERRSDARRRNALQRSGRVVIEFTTADVLDDSDYVANTVGSWLNER